MGEGGSRRRDKGLLGPNFGARVVSICARSEDGSEAVCFVNLYKAVLAVT